MKTLLPALCALVVGASLSPAAQAPAVLALVGATVVDGTGAAPLANGVVVVRNGRIAEVGPASRVAVPDGAERVDLRGKTLLPGFVNAHGHATDASGQPPPGMAARPNVERQLRQYAQYGVTSVFSLGDDTEAGVAVRDQAARGRARLFIAGPVVGGTTAEAAAAAVDEVVAMNADWVKIRVDDNLGSTARMPRVAWESAIDRAHAAGLPVAAHIFYLEDAKALLREGVDLIAHSVRDAPVDAEMIRLARERDVCVVPTLTRELSTFVYASTPDFFSDPFFLRHTDAAAIAEMRTPERQAQFRSSPTAPRYKVALEQASRNVKQLRDAGVRIAMGTDTGPAGRFQGFFEHLEMELMVKAGLTPMQVIVAATGDAASCMRQAGQIGTIQPGAWADLAVFGASPAEDSRHTRTLERVFIAGVPLD